MSGNPVEVTDPGLGEPYTAVIDLSDPMYADAKYIRLSFDTADTDVQLAEDVATQTASVPMLLSVGDYADEVELISGIKTGKVGIKVFDGKESFSKSSAYGAAFYIKSAASAWGAQKDIVMCSHYLGLATVSSAAAEGTCFFNASGHFYFRVADNSDTAAFTADLAAKYASGNPVIVVYPLATETTESVTPQQLTLAEGTNIIYATANVEPLTAKCEYQAVSALDILSALLGTRSGTEDMSIKDAKDVVNVILGDDNK